MTIKDRVYAFIDYKGITVRRFEEVSGLSNGYVSSMRKGFGGEKLNNVLRSFPDLNREWLLYGEGEMLNRNIIQQNQNGDNLHGNNVTIEKTEKDYLEIIKSQAEQLSKSQEQIDRLLSIIENISK